LNEEVEITPYTYNEVNYIIQKLRYNKVPGPDNIISELIKEGGQKLKHRIHMLNLKIWGKRRITGRLGKQYNMPNLQKRRSIAM
jgi:hypothetical protein